MTFEINKFLKLELDKIILPGGFKIQKMYEFVHYLYFRQATQYFRTNDNFFINIHRDILRKFFTTNGIKQKQYINILKTYNIIEVKKNKFGKETYVASNINKNDPHSKAYRISTILLDKINIKEFNLYVNIKASKMYNTMLSENFKRPTTRSLRYQYDVMKKHLKIDYDKASNWIIEQFTNGNINKRQYAVYLKQIEHIDNHKIFISKGEQTDRIYTNIVSLKKELRSFCSFDTEKISDKGLDLKSSQPYFLANILIKEDPTNLGYQAFYELITGYNPVSNKKIYEKPDIYNFLASKSKIHIKRDIIKIQFLRVLFASNKGSIDLYLDKNGNEIDVNSIKKALKVLYPEKNEKELYLELINTLKKYDKINIRNLFQKTFPKVYKFIYEYKQTHIENGALAILLQQKEAEVFISVVDKINRENTPEYKVLVLSLHDALYTTDKFRLFVEIELKTKLMELGYKHYTLK